MPFRLLHIRKLYSSHIAFYGAICLLMLLILSGNSKAQTICASSQVNTSLKQSDKKMAAGMQLNEESIRTTILQKKKQSSIKRTENIYTIPVVVHVLHTGGAIGTMYNPDDNQIIETINYLNEVYSGTWPGLTPAGADAAGDIGLRFVLAKRDPDCNPTNGIDRVDMSGNLDYVANGTTTELSNDIALKSPVVWDRSAYYNIYVVNKINGMDGSEGQAIGGFAYFPTTSIVDGTVILAREMIAGSKILVHELGHAFSLYHTFEGSENVYECPTGDGDLVDDTEPVSYNISANGVIDFSCRTGANPCNSGKPFSIRTENNFMNYTTCFTLFTPGQRDRVQASVVLPDRNTLFNSSAAYPTYQIPACSPRINFERKAMSLARTGINIEGCRKYTDYTVGLSIGNHPSADATVTVYAHNPSTAIEGIDYSFPAGKVVLFPAGVLDTQHIVIRIYQDENVPQSKLLRLGFSINNNGGNAIAGTAIPVADFTIEPNNTSPLIPGDRTKIQVGKPMVPSPAIKLFNATFQDFKVQILYNAKELREAGMSVGNITAISFIVQKQTAAYFKNMQIKMGLTGFTNLLNGGNLNRVDNLNNVLFLPAYTTVNGLNTFELSTPFYWNGSDNIVVELCMASASITGNEFDEVQSFSTSLPDNTGDIIFGETSTCDQALTSFSYFSGIKPIIQFDCVITGNPIQNEIVTSNTEYLGPWGEVFFYDNSTPSKILGKVKNLSNFNFGCIKMSIDRSGEGVSPFWSNDHKRYLAQKTFFITPEFNNPSGKYELTLYYSDKEKKGYEIGTGQSWSNTSIIKTQVPVSEITPQNPQAAKVQIANITQRDSYGNGYAVSAVFSTGFSGFGIGEIDAALPVEWGKVNAIPEGDDVKVEWNTVSESNNNYFEVEVSNNGREFSTIAKLPATGNSSNLVQYTYLHQSPASDKLYYRIKQVDKDGKYSYSQVVFVRMKSSNSYKPTLYPVPAGSQLTIDFHKPVLNPVIELLSSDLKIVSINKKNGMVKSEQIGIPHLPAGAYLARISFEGKTWLIRFIKF